MNTTRRRFLAGCLGVPALALAGCSDEADPATPGGAASADPVRFVFANAAEAPTLDPSVTATLETSRIAAQILEPLVRANPDTGTAVPHLAESWSISPDGLAYTFTLRQDVRFQDGTDLTADAVARNFERWLRNTRAENVSQTTYQSIFRSSTPEGEPRDSIYQGCEAPDERTVVLRIADRYPPLLKALTQPAFGIGSPAAFEDEEAYLEHPVGTGPFRMGEREGGTVTLRRFDDHWGEAAQLDELAFTSITGAAKRYYHLVRGDVDGYDQVGLDDFVSLARRGMQVQQRDPYCVAFLALNQDFGPLKDRGVRQAVAHAINRGAVARGYYPEGTNVANDFTPALFQVGGEDTGSAYRQDQGLAKSLLEESEYDGEELTFYYPTDVSLPYLQQPAAVYAEIAADLVEAGFAIRPVPVRWGDNYLKRIAGEDSSRALALTGITGTYRDPADFVSPLFGQENPLLGARDEELFARVRRAAALPDGQERSDLYRSINERVAEEMLAVPLAFPVSAVALSQRVRQYPLSATGVENFAHVEVQD
ncbi:ABC transporter substrate-binding protein [Rothia sp. AR01]|uniref:ABC transporter substrate-binding protein n=1 Tax=Rothia santali TaxID=2949643 RepID=A0A9X2HBG1_9MICC|nr:ABC transporter substrate-binding protein [Rothia santali]MCP3426231.1 ABC transporter substrate-binding protein [Rothia santali]